MHFEATVKHDKKTYDLFISDGATYGNAENTLMKYMEEHSITEFSYTIKRSNIDILIVSKDCGVFFKVETKHEDIDGKNVTERFLVECELTTEAEQAMENIEDINSINTTKIIEVL